MRSDEWELQGTWTSAPTVGVRVRRRELREKAAEMRGSRFCGLCLAKSLGCSVQGQVGHQSSSCSSSALPKGRVVEFS